MSIIFDLSTTTLTTLFVILIFVAKMFSLNTRRKVFLVDFACHKPPKTQTCSNEKAMEKFNRYINSEESAIEILKMTFARCGMGNSTYLSEGLMMEPPSTSRAESRREAEAVIFGSVDELLEKTGVVGKDINIVIVNCSIFNDVPSLCGMLVNRYKIGDDVLSYNLSGMGCSAGLSAIALAERLLQVHPNTYALVVSTENITENVYYGSDKSMLFSNCLFRVGGAAILLSNRPSDRRVAKYQFSHVVHTNTTSSDMSYNCVYQEEDDEGFIGVRLSKDLVTVVNKSIEANIKTLARSVLPASEKIIFVFNHVLRALHVPMKPYVPQFNRAIDHVYTHVGGKPLLDALEKRLCFTAKDLEPSRMTLYRFGNTSSSSVWYGLAYAEAKDRIKRGNRLWQIAFGSGFVCISVIWKALRAVDCEEKNPWADEIDHFPADLSGISSRPYYLNTNN